MKQRLPTLILIAATALLTVGAGMMMFSVYMFYDDEGYVLVSLRNFAEHGKLYREVYSQYGPFPYAFYYALNLLGLPLTHTAGRLVTLLAWSGTAFACALLVGRATRNLAAQLAVLASVFAYLWIMGNEPTHPGGLVAIMVALLASIGHRWLEADRVPAWAWLVGAGTAALALTKINTGAFAAFAAVGWLLLHHQHPTVRRWAPGLLLVGVVALPFALMRPLLDAAWVQTYALLFASAGFSAVGAAALGASPRAGWAALGRGTLGGLAVAAVVLGVIFARGTSPTDLLEGVLLRPMRHPVHFNLNFPWAPGAVSAALASTGLFVLAWLLRRRWPDALDLAVACLRVVAALALGWVILRFPAISPDNLVLAFASSALWLFLWPLAGEPPAAVAARTWVGLLYLGQTLHAFPVRGSQIAWGTFLAFPLAALGAFQALRWIAARFPAARLNRHTMRLALATAVIAFALVTGWRLLRVGQRFQEGRNLALPGAEFVRLPDTASALFQFLSLNAAAHGNMLFSLPGMYSLNLWSGLPTPNLVNVTHWFSLLDKPQHEAIVRALDAHPRAVVIVQREHMKFIESHGFDKPNPLSAYITKNFYPAFTLDGFEFCVRRGRPVVPLHLAEVFERAPAAAGQANTAGDTLITFNVLLPAATAVASIEIVATHRPELPPIVLRGAESRVELTPINLRGEATSPARPAAWPFRTSGPTAVSLYFDRHARNFPLPVTLLVLRDETGAQIALVRLRP